MKVILTVLAVAVVILATSFASIKVKSDYRKQVDLMQYQTYGWIEQPVKPFAYLASPVDRRWIVKLIKQEVNEKLKSRGYRWNDSSPDFLIAYHANVKGKIETAPIGYDSDSEMYVHREITVKDYQEGSLVLDFVDGKSNELIWRGVAVGAIEDVEKIDNQVAQAIEKMLQRFPPRR